MPYKNQRLIGARVELFEHSSVWHQQPSLKVRIYLWSQLERDLLRVIYPQSVLENCNCVIILTIVILTVLRISISRKRSSLNLQDFSISYVSHIQFNHQQKVQNPPASNKGESIFLGSNLVWACLFSTFVPYNQGTTSSHFAGYNLVIFINQSPSSSISTYLLFRDLLGHSIDRQSKELSLTEAPIVIKCNY